MCMFLSTSKTRYPRRPGIIDRSDRRAARQMKGPPVSAGARNHNNQLSFGRAVGLTFSIKAEQQRSYQGSPATRGWREMVRCKAGAALRSESYASTSQRRSLPPQSLGGGASRTPQMAVYRQPRKELARHHGGSGIITCCLFPLSQRDDHDIESRLCHHIWPWRRRHPEDLWL